MQTPYVSVQQQERSWMQLSDTLHVHIQPSQQTQKQLQRRRSKATALEQPHLNQIQMHQQMTQTGVGPDQVGARIAVHHQQHQQQQQPSMHAQQSQQQQQSQPQSQRRRHQKSSSHQQPKRQRRQPPMKAEQVPKKAHKQVYLEAAKQMQDRSESSRGGVDVGGQGSSEEHMLGPRQGSLDMLRDIAAAQNQQDSSIIIDSLRRDNHYALGLENLFLTNFELIRVALICRSLADARALPLGEQAASMRTSIRYPPGAASVVDYRITIPLRSTRCVSAFANFALPTTSQTNILERFIDKVDA